jgi:putative ABC transport system permease protein
VFLPSNLGPLLDGYKIDGEMPALGTAAIPLAVADALDVSVGDDITCSIGYSSGTVIVNDSYVETITYVNLTYEVGAIWQHSGEVDQAGYYYYDEWDWRSGNVNVAEVENPIVLNMADASGEFLDAVGPLLGSYTNLVCTYQVWTDRDAIVKVTDIAGTLEKLEYIGTRLSAVSYGGVQFNCMISSPLYSLNTDLGTSKLLFIGLSAPVIALGTYLSIVGVELGSNERRREAGMLKARGASSGNVFGSLMLEAVVLGTIAGVSGLLGGVLVSRLLLGITTVDTGYDARFTDLYITPWTVGLSILFAVFLMLASSYRSIKRIARMEISEALHFYTPSTTKIGYKMRYDIAALVLVGLNVWTVLYWSDDMLSGNDSLILTIIIFVAVLVGISITPFMPFLLSVGLSRLLTRGPGGLYRRFVVLMRPWTRELHYLVEKNIARNPRRASNICVMVSLAMAFGLVISITFETNIAYARAVAVDTVGSDIRVTGGPYDPSVPVDLEAIDAVSDLPGVDESCRFHFVDGYVNWNYQSVAAFDPAGYLYTVDPSSSYFVDGGPRMLEDLEVEGTMAVTDDAAERFGWLVGDVFPAMFRIEGYNESTSYTYEDVTIEMEIVGIVKDGLPGLSYADVFTSIETLAPVEELMAISLGCFVKVADGYDHDAIASSVVSAFDDAGAYANARLLQDELEGVIDEPAMRALADFLYVEYSLAFVIMTAGIGLVVFVTVSDREREIACIMARGSSSSQMRRILMGESMSIMALGLIIGTSVGLVSAYLFNLVIVGVSGSPIPHDMIFSFPSYIIVVASVASFLLASYLATARAGKVRLAEVLRIRGG